MNSDNICNSYTQNLDDDIFNKWSNEEDSILLKKAEVFNYHKWDKIAYFLPYKNKVQCLHRINFLRPNLKKGKWTREEDEKLLKLISIHGKNWFNLSKIFKNRNAKQIRDRYVNILDPTINRTKFTQEEDNLILELFKKHGTCWSSISKKFNNRTCEMIKNRFYSHLKKKYLNYKQLNNCYMDNKIDLSIKENKADNEFDTIQSLNAHMCSLINEIKTKQSNDNILIKNLSIINKLFECTKYKLDYYKQKKY